MNIRKTQRKNKTKQVVSWPSTDTYFTIEDLVSLNQHMLTSSGSNITLRVRLSNAVSPNDGSIPIVAEIGQKNLGKGRPQKAYAMRPVKQSAINKATADGISVDVPKIMPIMEISVQPNVMPTPTQVPTPNTNVSVVA